MLQSNIRGNLLEPAVSGSPHLQPEADILPSSILCKRAGEL